MTLYCVTFGESDFERRLYNTETVFDFKFRYETTYCEQYVMVVLHMEIVIDILQF